MDVLIHTQVMGNHEEWAVFFGGSVYGDGLEKAKAQEMLERIQGDYKGQIRNDFQVPYYSTSISDAWQVVEKLRIAIIPLEGGRWAAMQDEVEGGWYERRLPASYDDPSEPQYWEVADTAPLVICLAALKAVGWKEDD